MLADRDEPLGPVRREIVVALFVDIVGFTRVAERMPLEAVVATLREFHDPMTAQIFACGGSVEKYIGDGIFAVFGVPEPSAEDAANALRCAERMVAAFDVWNDERKQQGETPLAFGIGLNCGPAVIGDVGSEQSLSFTVIGDTVNTVSQLQGAYAPPGHPAGHRRSDRQRHQCGAIAGRGGTPRRACEQGERSLHGRSAPVRIWTWLNQR